MLVPTNWLYNPMFSIGLYIVTTALHYKRPMRPHSYQVDSQSREESRVNLRNDSTVKLGRDKADGDAANATVFWNPL